jgi:predicted short-subunit dehydrogenase-like oxidoreductase (DUF2520 family)
VTHSSGRSIALVGPGRAGTAFALACIDEGDRVIAVAGRAPDVPTTREVAARLGARAVAVEDIAHDADLVVVATPDASIAEVAAALVDGLRPGSLVVHLSGARGLDALQPIASARDDVALGALHPLQTLPSGDAGREALRGAWAAVAGPPEVTELAEHLGLRPFEVADAHRATYHAAACVASNHLVALLGQVQRLATAAGVPFEAFGPLVHSSVEHAFEFGPARALTGPVARGDAATVAAHLDAIPAGERAAYRALASQARRLVERDDPALESLLGAPT